MSIEQKETVIEAYARQEREWHDISDELCAADRAGKGEGVTAHQVTTKLRERLLARGEKFITYGDLLPELEKGVSL